jgi:hypothetical protein
MKNSNTEYQNPFLNKINLFSPSNNILPLTLSLTDPLLSGALSLTLNKQERPALKEKLIRHNPAATSE